jgi:hypothetical protein
MQTDTLKYYVGKLVKVNAVFADNGRPSYVGKVCNFDSDFVTLNPFANLMSGNYSVPNIETLRKCKAGKTDLQITIGRRCIETIEEVVSDE